MKTTKVIEGGRIGGGDRSTYNLNCVTEDGGHCSTQVWDGVDCLLKIVMEWISKGEDGRRELNPWSLPIWHIFIKCHQDNQVYHFDLSNKRHADALNSQIFGDHRVSGKAGAR